MISYYVAIDGGGTKTDVALFDDAGHVVNRIIGKSTNPSALPEEQIRENFGAIFTQLFSTVKPGLIKNCFAGMSGCDHPKLKSLIKMAIQETIPVPCEHLHIENDAVNALWSGTEGAPGLVVIAGTGSIAYGRLGDGTSFRIGGWGHLVGDDGSGYYIGKEAVRHALRAHDGMESQAPFFEKIKRHFNIRDMPDVIPVVYSSNKTALAELAPIVVESATEGDQAAIHILKDAAYHLSELIESGLSRANDPKLPVVLVGGLWRSELIRKEVTGRFNRKFILPEYPPIYGSMVGALGHESSKEILASLKSFF